MYATIKVVHIYIGDRVWVQNFKRDEEGDL